MKASRSPVITKSVIDLQPGDILIGSQGGQSVIEDSSDQSGLLGFLRVETEHGHLYMELDAEVQVMEKSKDS